MLRLRTPEEDVTLQVPAVGERVAASDGAGDDMTLVTYGLHRHLSLEAAELLAEAAGILQARIVAAHQRAGRVELDSVDVVFPGADERRPREDRVSDHPLLVGGVAARHGPRGRRRRSTRRSDIPRLRTHEDVRLVLQ